VRGIDADHMADAFPQEPYKVNLYREPGEIRLSRAEVDLTRNGRWDEKWTFTWSDGGKETITRAVSPKDDGQYTVAFTLVRDKWIPVGAAGR
jgi:hypothetical protein